MNTFSQSVPELLGQMKSKSERGRYLFARQIFEDYMTIPFRDYTGVRKSQILELLFIDSTLAACFDDPDYRDFVMMVAERLVAAYGTESFGIGTDIEGCLWELSEWPPERQSSDFSDFCLTFAKAIRPYVENADDHYKMAHIILPLGNTFSRHDNPGMDAIREHVADFLIGKRQGYKMGLVVGSSTGGCSIDDFLLLLRAFRKRSDGFFRIVLAGYMANQPIKSTQYVLKELGEVEVATREVAKMGH